MTELMQLWQQRDELTKSEWGRLYQLVYKVLKTGNYPILSNLQFEIDDYIQEYFLNKIFIPAKNEIFYDNALRTFFRNYLIDCFHYENASRNTDKEENGESLTDKSNQPLTKKELAELNIDLDRLSAKFHQEVLQIFLLEFDVDTAKQIFRLLLEFPLEIEDARFFFRDAELKPKWVMSFLRARLNLKSVKSSARNFLSKNKEWVNLYLSLHTCVDNQTKLPLSKLAKLYKIPAYHYRARELGITRKKGQFEEGYEETILGKWLLSLGLTTKIENSGAIEVAFKILCSEALFFTKK